MWGSRRDADRESVVCIACGDSLPRDDAREYDKEGNRWERHDKEFEYLCKGCYGDLCHQPRADLEPLLCDLEKSTDGPTREEFVRAYQDAVSERYGTPESDPDPDRRGD
ncbi:DUF7562 family protein [Candidatus Halobonum tyrrellensis]|uniref:Small CPxCG-related zinc finger protein n=1 Tax=Candidatus Halobonum tyrrellensis G22 TaxID=1324957 RepID=V4HA38_9EURY|nr:hypothetical protein [Candidatus Halobonum tyrrellensis]ESP87580.1 hypothetical protein K933_13389 [Candidatus Halobonum tyrrellensis G22]